MNLFGWLKKLFGPKQIARDVSGLSTGLEGQGHAPTKEVIESKPVPLREGSRRMTHRDPRLLPKPKPAVVNYWERKKRPKIIERQEADRLFSLSMRTSNRKIRDLATDVTQLRRYGLPEWTSEKQLADVLELSVGQLRHYSMHRLRETTSHYVTFAIPKRSGGRRLIHAPKTRLKACLRKVLRELTSRLPVSPYAHGFVPERSVATNAAVHVGKKVVIKLDLADCFPSIHVGRIRGLLIAYGYNFPVAQTLAVLMTEAERQPVEIGETVYQVPTGPRVCVQGAPTSPSLCNAVMMRMDHRLAGLARKHGFTFSRYADDLTFSGDDTNKVRLIIKLATKIANSEGFQINEAKTRVMRSGGHQQVTGVTVNKTLGLSRKERRKVRAAIHQVKQKSEPLSQQLQGKLAYISMLNPDQAKSLTQ